MDQFRKYSKEHAEISPVVAKFAQYQSAQEDELRQAQMELLAASKEEKLGLAQERLHKAMVDSQYDR
jgi:peptide chain release factor 1